MSKFRLVVGENRLRGSRTVARGFELPVTPGLREDISNCLQQGDLISMERCDSHLDPVIVSVVRTSRKSRSESVKAFCTCRVWAESAGKRPHRVSHMTLIITCQALVFDFWLLAFGGAGPFPSRLTGPAFQELSGGGKHSHLRCRPEPQ